MATKTVVTYVCDGCGKQSHDELDIETHTVTVDHQAVEVDACTRCWAKAATAMEKLTAHGRKITRSRPRRRRTATNG